MSSIPDNIRTIPVDLGGGAIMHVEASVLPSSDGTRPQDISFSPGNPLHFAEVIDLLGKLSASVLEGLKRCEPTKPNLDYSLDVGVKSGQLTALLVKRQALTAFDLPMLTAHTAGGQSKPGHQTSELTLGRETSAAYVLSEA